MFHHFLTLFVTLSLFLSACGQSPHTSSVKSIASDHAQAAKKKSTINVPITFTTEQIRDLVNPNIPVTLHSQSGIRINGNVTGQVVITRLAAPTYSMVNNAIEVRIPLQVKGRVDVKVDLGLFDAKESKETFPRATMIARIVPKFNPDFTFNPDVTVSYTLDRAATINLLGFKIHIVKQLRSALNSNLGKIAATIKSAASGLPVRDIVTKGWNQLHTPIAVGENAWLSVLPKQVALSSMTTQGNTASFNVTLTAETSAYYGVTPPRPAPSPLPALTANTGAQGFFINVPVAVSYTAIQQQLQAFEGQVINVSDNHNLQFSQFKVSSDGHNRIVIDAAIHYRMTDESQKTSAADAHVTLYAQPSYNATTGKVSIGNLMYSAESKTRLSQGGPWLFNPVVLRSVSEVLHLDVRPQIEALRTSFNRDQKTNSLSESICLKTALSHLDFVSIHPRQSQLELVLEAKGTLGLDLVNGCR